MTADGTSPALTLEELTRLSREFRAAIEGADKARLFITFENFPRGSCGDAALLLARYLSDHGAGMADYVLGARGVGNDAHSHAWLQLGDLIIDITADQFPDQPEPVIVATDSPWHEAFEGKVQHAADFELYGPPIAPSLRASYQVVLATLQASKAVQG